MALPRNPLETFIWGQGGVAMTPEQVAREREIAAALSDQGADFSPVGHWLEGAARLGHSAAGAFRDWRASEGERAGREGFSDRWSSVFGGGGSSPVAEALASSVSPTALDAANAVAATPLPEGTEWLNYANQGATRNLPLSEQLTSALSFLPELGVTMEVFSGGQPEAGQGARVGSTRHDHGNAADVFFYRDGERLDWANPEHVPIFEEIVRRGRAAGITGFGAGEGYMRPGSMHIGFGAPGVWGAGGSGANAPDWLRAAYEGAPATAQTGLPQNAAPGAVMAGPDGRNYMYAETAGMAGATGDYGWIPYNGGGTSEQPVQVAQAGGFNPSIAELLALTGDPNFGYASPAQQQIIQSLIGQNLQEQAQARDPLRQLQIEQLRSEVEAEPFVPVPMTPEQMALWGIPEGAGSWTLGADGMPQQIFAPPATADSAAEAKIGRLMELGYTRDQAIQMSDQFVLGQDENQRSVLLNIATGKPAQPILLPGQVLPDISSAADLDPLPGSTEFPPVGTEAPNYSTLPEGTDIGAALGVGGTLAGGINSVVDYLFGTAPIEGQQQASNALQNLRLQTNQALLEGFAGRQNVYTQEMIDDLAVTPGMPPNAARDRFAQTRTLMDQQIARIENEVLANPSAWTPQDVREARASVASLRALRDTYDAVLQSIQERQDSQNVERPPLETFVRQ